MKYFFFTLFIILSVFMQAQSTQFGLKGGVNYNFSGDLTQTTETENITHDVLAGAENQNGFHAGIFYKLKYSGLFIKTELLYSEFENSFDTPIITTLTTKKIDIPIVAGIKIFGPIYIYGGPDFQYIMDEDFSENYSDITYEDFTTGLHVGLGIEYKRISAEVRWDRGLSANDIEILGDTSGYNYTLDNRPNQILFSLQLALTNKE